MNQRKLGFAVLPAYNSFPFHSEKPSDENLFFPDTGSLRSRTQLKHFLEINECFLLED
jgi:hypothetical protein